MTSQSVSTPEDECAAAWVALLEEVGVTTHSWQPFIDRLFNSGTYKLFSAEGRGVSREMMQAYTDTGKTFRVPRKLARQTLKDIFDRYADKYKVAISEGRRPDVGGMVSKALDLSKALEVSAKVERKNRRDELKKLIDPANPKAVTEREEPEGPEQIARSEAVPTEASHVVPSSTGSSDTLSSELQAVRHIAREASLLTRQALRHATPKAIRGDMAWKLAKRIVTTFDKRHLYMELLSVITPRMWDSEVWGRHQANLFDLLWEYELDTARRLHVLDVGRLPVNFASRVKSAKARRAIKQTDTASHARDNELRELRALMLAEYLAGIRTRALFLCQEDVTMVGGWPFWEKAGAFIFDVGIFYQSKPKAPPTAERGLSGISVGDPLGYRVIFTNLRPFEAEQQELALYAFGEKETEAIYWLLKANFYRLLRCDSDQLFTIFSLFDENTPFGEQVDEKAVLRYLPEKLKGRLKRKGNWFEQVGNLFTSCASNKEKKPTQEFYFAFELKAWLKGREALACPLKDDTCSLHSPDVLEENRIED